MRDRPEEKEEPDYSKQLDTIAEALRGMGSIAQAVSALRADLAGLARAVAGIERLDVKPIVTAISDLADAQRELSAAFYAPRSLVFDSKGDPVGVEIERPN